MYLDQPTSGLQYSHLDETMQVVCATSNTHIWMRQCELCVQLQILTFGSDNVSCICGNDIPKKTRQKIWMMAKNGKTKHSLNQKILQVSNPKEQHTGLINSTTKNIGSSSHFQDERERERESN